MRRMLLAILTASALWAPIARAQTIDAVMDSVQYTAFRYFWDQANATNGMIRDRSQGGSPASIAAVGFGLSAICIGIDHGWITRAEGAARVATTLNTFWTLPQGTATSGTIGYKGFFYHFLDMNTGLRMVSWDTELSTIDTALLLAGILDAKVYFDGPEPNEVQIRTQAEQIYDRIDWEWIRNPGNNAIRHGWKPNGGAGTFLPYDWIGYSEAMILNILALGSPTFPVPTATWTAWTSGYNYQSPQVGTGQFYTPAYVVFAPLFGHQYSHCWIDFRNRRDTYMQARNLDYFENSRHATLAQRQYCILNPGLKPGGTQNAGYHATYWGLTAGDGPSGYNARGAPPPQNDDGTVAPTAAISSIPFAPEVCLPTLQYLWDTYKSAPINPAVPTGPKFWGAYGFRDGMNLARNPDWFGPDWLGIDQGPMILMIENYRTGRVWDRFMRNYPVQLGLQRAGFTKVTGVDDPPRAAGLDLRTGPNPFTARATLRYRLREAGTVRLTVHDLTGREVARLVDGWQLAGEHVAHFDADSLPNGVYWYRLEIPGLAVASGRGVLMR